MKKLKLLFPLIATSALAVTPVLTVGIHKPVNNLSDKTLHVISTDNNNSIFYNGKTDEYYYDNKTFLHGSYYTEANLTFQITPYGASLLAKAVADSSSSAGYAIMEFLSQNLKHFDNTIKNSYLHEIEGFSDDHLMGSEPGEPIDWKAYSRFRDNMSQAAGVVSQIQKLINEKKGLPAINVRFHYNWHTFLNNDYDVSFDTAIKNVVPAWDWNGHFPGMGPYGPKGDQDAASAIGNDDMFTLTFDLSTRSIKWINEYYIVDTRVSKNDTPAYGIYDYLTDAYPHSPFTTDLYELKEANDPAISTIMNAMVQYIGTHRTNGQLLLNLKPAFEIIAKNQPSGVQYQATHQW